MDFDLAGADDVVTLGPGQFFGEIGALNGWPQSVTVKALTPCVVVQIRVPALRLLKRQSSTFRKKIDAVYRERALLPQLRACPVFKACPDALLAGLAERVDLVSCKPGETVIEEGAPVDALYVVRSGFMRLSRRMGQGRATVTYLSKGMSVGEVELLIDGLENARFTVSSVGYGELVRIARSDLEEVLREAPVSEQELWRAAVARIKETGAHLADPRSSEFVEFALDKGLVEGNSILVMNLDVCTRCDDCVRACADTHGGRPRFVREGDRYDNLLIAKSCYHCQDPVCLIGCPTGAIRRANVGDVVEIKEQICIGCATCHDNCPYDAIVMQDTGTTWPDDALPKALRGSPRAVASKCDLCYTSSAGPACVRNCPHHCAFRVGSIEEFRALQRTAGQ
jgi:Fe-S-cluster-containing hydrogenase component 2/CRP-like cAMP-binding protein